NADNKGAYFSARNADGQELWRSLISDKLPVATGGDWQLAEPADKKEVVLTWKRDGQDVVYHLETNTGKVLRQEITPTDPTRSKPKTAAPLNQANESDEDRLKRLEKEIQELRQKLQKQGPASPPRSPDGKLSLASKGEDLYVVDAASGQIIRRIRPDGVTKIVGESFSADGTTIIVGGAQGQGWE